MLFSLGSKWPRNKQEWIHWIAICCKGFFFTYILEKLCWESRNIFQTEYHIVANIPHTLRSLIILTNRAQLTSVQHISAKLLRFIRYTRKIRKPKTFRLWKCLIRVIFKTCYIEYVRSFTDVNCMILYIYIGGIINNNSRHWLN